MHVEKWKIKMGVKKGGVTINPYPEMSQFIHRDWKQPSYEMIQILIIYTI